MVVKAIPEGFHSITPYLVVKGASDAIEFYKRAFGAVEEYRLNSPDGKSIVNAEIKIGDSVVMLSDEFPQGSCRSPRTIGGTTVMMHIYTEDVDRAFNQAVAAGATVMMPVMDMFWGDRYGQLAKQPNIPASLDSIIKPVCYLVYKILHNCQRSDQIRSDQTSPHPKLFQAFEWRIIIIRLLLDYY